MFFKAKRASLVNKSLHYIIAICISFDPAVEKLFNEPKKGLLHLKAFLAAPVPFS
jgi:hypothetical protein